jgi:hypothetical protein
VPFTYIIKVNFHKNSRRSIVIDGIFGLVKIYDTMAQ